MRHPSKVGAITGSIMALFVPKKGNVTFLNRKDEYCKNYWVNKSLSDGIELVALIERSTKKAAAEYLVKAGLSSYMGQKLKDYMNAERAAQASNEKQKPTRFVRILRRYAAEKGYDISKFI
jgi:hypothetical protein